MSPERSLSRRVARTAVSYRRRFGPPSSITSRRHSLRNGMGASGGTSRLPDPLRSASSLSAASIGSPARADRNSSASIKAGANLRSVFQRSAARTSGSSPARLASSCTSSRTRSSLGQPTASSTASKASHVALLRRGERLDGAVEQAHQAPDVAGAGGIPAPGGVARFGEQAADQLVGHVQHRVRQPRFEVEHGGHQDCAPAVLGIAPELMGVGGVALAHELLQPLLMDAAGALGRHADAPDQLQPVQQLADVVRLGRDRHGLEPGEGRHAHGRVNDEQPVQLGHLLSGQSDYQGVGRPLAGTRPAGDGDALDHGRAGQDDAGGPQGRNDRRGDGLAAVGAAGRLRRRLDHRRQVGHGRRAQAQGGSELARVVGHGLRAAGVFSEGGCRDFELARHPGHEGVGRLVEIGERRAGMAQQGELHGAAEAVGIAAAFRHEVPVGPGQGEQPRQGVGVGRNAQERLALLIGQQLSACQGVSPVPQTSMLIMDGTALGDVVCGRVWAVRRRGPAPVQGTTVWETR